jgi:hypothetical protein
MKTLRYGLNEQEQATVLAALRYYQMQGLGDPANRPDAIHEIATGVNDTIVSLDDKGINALCERLNMEDVERIDEKVRKALRCAIRRAEKELLNWPMDQEDNAEHRVLRKALGKYQEAWDLLG